MRALVPHRGAVCRLRPSPGQLPQRQLSRRYQRHYGFNPLYRQCLQQP
ncbi:MAG TPA: hypothetical protein PLX97_08350 [Gemmatales bacterium]|nr:hypothetical protein [Gemmatales bacterium]